MEAPSLISLDALEIRSFRLVFALERRIFRLQSWRLPLPYGVPVSGIAYAAAALLAVVAGGALPVVGSLVAAVPAPVRFVFVPLGIAAVLTRARIDGRPAHMLASSWLGLRLAPRHVDCFEPCAAPGRVEAIVEPIALAVDPADPAYRPARIVGPARVRLQLPSAAEQAGATLRIAQTGEQPLRRPRLVSVPAGGNLVVEAAR